MILLLGFAFLAGIGTALSPCVLPVLPIALSAGATGGPRRPLGVVTGLALSFTFAAVVLVYAIAALGLPNDLLRKLAVAGLLVFGLALVVPSIGARLEARLSRMSSRGRPVRSGGGGFRGGLAVGVSLGFVYTPCAGPILASVITVSASQSFSAGRLFTAAAYGIGSAVALYALMLGGRRVTRRLAARSGRLQQGLGVVMVIVAALMLADLDIRFETAIANSLPSFLTNPTGALEQSGSVKNRLRSVNGQGPGSGPSGEEQAARGRPLPRIAQAPALVGTQRWFNTPGGRPLSLAELRRQHRVVLIDFWTYTCINCIRTLPQLRGWYAKYRHKGLTIIGVHTPEFPFEKDAGNVASAIAANGLRYPVVQDNDYATWMAYHNQYWPAEYLIDAKGVIRYEHFGEGNYDVTEKAIRSLLREAGAGGLGAMTPMRAQPSAPAAATPESYLGAQRAARFAGGQIVVGPQDFGGGQPQLPASHLAYRGRWSIAADFADAGRDAALYLRFSARRVFLVLSSPGRSRRLRVELDGRPVPARLAGRDVHDGTVVVRGQRLYSLLDLPRMGDHVLKVLPDPGVRAYVFTFG